MFRVIVSMSDTKKEVERSLTLMTHRIVEHLFKIYAMPTSTAVNHWKSEIYGFVHDVNRLKSTKRFPSANQIYSWTYGKYADKIDYVKIKSMVEDLEFKHGYHLIDINLNTLLREFDIFVQDYFSWLAELLSKTGTVNYKDVSMKIDSMISQL